MKKVQDILKKGTTEVLDGLKHYKVLFHENTEIFAIIKVIISQLDRGDISSISLNTNGIELYVKKMAEISFIDEIENCEAVDIQKLQDSLSLLKLMLPRDAEEIPGILAHVSSLLADQAISLYDIMVHHSDKLIIIFVISELHASKARDILLKLNNDAQRN